MHISRLSTSAGILALSFGTSFAADLPPVSLLPYSWTGFYAGINIGHMQADGRVVGDAFANNAPLDIDYDSLTLGGQVGYNHQWDFIVAGVEADIGTIAGNGGTATTNFFSFPAEYNTNISTVATIRARAGLAFDQLFIYGTGGFAWARVENQALTPNSDILDLSHTSWRNGTVWGGGVEFALDDNLSVKVEGLRFDFDSNKQTADAIGASYGFEFEDSATVVRAGLNFNF